MTTVLPLAYLGNVHWFARLCAGGCVVDVGEHYIKQSLRSRCTILGANGPVVLTVPVVKFPNDAKAVMREVRIDYSKRWQHLHWTSMVAAYRSAPYFDHYAGHFEPFFTQRYERLFDLNAGLTETVLRLLGDPAELVFSQEYIASASCEDLRHSLSEKPRLGRPDPYFMELPYYQTFAREGFAGGMSVVDLLFNEGPAAAEHLRACVEGL